MQREYEYHHTRIAFLSYLKHVPRRRIWLGILNVMSELLRDNFEQ